VPEVDLVTFMAIAGPAASFGGAWWGMKWKQDHLLKKIEHHETKHQEHDKRLAAHDLAIGLLQGGNK